MNTPATQPVAAAPQSNDAWVPVLAGAFGMLGAAIASFLSAGFTSIAEAVSALGSIAPADDRLGPTAGLALVLVLCTIGAIPVARKQIQTDATRIPAMAAGVAGVALVLAFPPAQWLTFGRPDPASLHHHDMQATAESTAHEQGDEPNPVSDDEHHETGEASADETDGDEHAPAEPAHDDSDGHEHEAEEP